MGLIFVAMTVNRQIISFDLLLITNIDVIVAFKLRDFN